MSKHKKRKKWELGKKDAVPDKVVISWGVAVLPKRDSLNAEHRKALAGCSKVICPNSFRILRKDDLDYCRKTLERVELSSNLERIENSAFKGCGRLAEVSLPEGLTAIGEEAFSGCRELKSVRLPASLRSVGAGAFKGCSRLETVVVPSGVETVGKQAFGNCGKLAEFILESSDTEVGEKALQGCVSDMRVVVGKDEVGPDNPLREHMGVPDEGDFVVAKGALVKYKGHANPLRIPEGIKVVSVEALESSDPGSSPLEVLLPDSFVNLKESATHYWAAPPKRKLIFRFPENILEKPQNLNAYTLNKALESRRRSGGVTQQERARIFLAFKGADYRKSEKSLTGEGGTEALLDALSACSLKSATERAASFFYRRPELFSPAQTRRLAKEIRSRRKGEAEETRKDPKGLPWPEAIMDELLESLGYDPRDPVFSEARGAKSSRKASPAWVKGAVLPYLMEERKRAQNEGREKPRLYASAELCASKVNRADLARLVGELWKRSEKGDVPIPATAFLRYASEEDFMKRILSIVPQTWASNSDLSPLQSLLIDGMGLSETRSALRWAAGATKSGKYYAPIAKYVRLRFPNLPEDARFPESLLRDGEGRLVLAGRSKRLVAEIGPGLRPFVADPETGKTWRRLPQKLEMPEHERERLQMQWETLTGFLKELKAQLDEIVFQLYWKGERIPAAKLARWLENPLTASALEGTVWTREEEDFAVVNRAAVDLEGRAFDLGAEGRVRPAHILSEGAEKMKAWRERFSALGVSGWMTQLAEPLYGAEALQKDRYSGMTARAGTLRDRATQHFLLEAMAAMDKRNQGIRYSTGRYESELWLRELKIERIGRRENLTLYLLDQLTAEDQIRRGRLSALPAMASVTNVKLKNLIKTAQQADQTAFVAGLLEFQKARERDKRLSDEFGI